MRGFRYRHHAYIAELEPIERRVLATIVADVGMLLGADFSANLRRTDSGDDAPLDPENGAVSEVAHLFEELQDVPSREELSQMDQVFERLFPNVNPDDDAVSEEFHRLAFAQLRDDKVERLRMVWADLQMAGDKLIVQPQRAMDWAAALTDVRLVLADRLGIETDEDAAALEYGDGQDEPAQALATIYAVVSWLQDSLITVMTRRL